MRVFSGLRGPVWVVACALLFVSVPPVASDDGPLPQNDAGSGGDAPDALSQDITVEPDVVYEGMSPGRVLDNVDVYHLVGEAGQVFQGLADGNLGCYDLLDEEGDPVGDSGCSYAHAPLNSGPMVVELPYTGDYYFEVIHLAPAFYKFGFSLTGTAPDVQTIEWPFGPGLPSAPAEPLPIPDRCNGDHVYVQGALGTIPRFSDDCYHMRTGLNTLDTADIDVLIVPPVSTYPERDLRVMRQAVEMWSDGIHLLAAGMGLDWLDQGVSFEIFVDDNVVSTNPLWDPEIVVVATNPAGGAGIGIDPLQFLFGGDGICHGQPNPLAGLDAWKRLPGFDSHHDGGGGTYRDECEGGGPICFAVNGATDPVPGVFDVFGLYDLVAHEVGHCLTVGHVGDALDHEADAVPYADIMSYTNQVHDKCVSTLDVQSFALTMSHVLLDTPIAANHAEGPGGAFQIQHPDDHRYASPTGRAEDCPQPDAGLVPGQDLPALPLDDDAGSGQDAPNGISQTITVAPDVVYRGTSVGPVLDTYDIYHFTAEAGQIFKGWSDGNLGCYHLLDAQGTEFTDYECSYMHVPINTPLELELPYTGDYYLRMAHIAPAVYHFGYSLTGEAPAVRLLDQL